MIFTQTVRGKGKFLAERLEKPLLLVFRSKLDDGVEGQGADEDGDKNPHVSCGQLFRHNAGIQNAQAASAIFPGNQGSEETFAVGSLHDVQGKGPLPVVLSSYRRDDLLGESAGFFLDGFLLRGKVESDHFFSP